MQFIPVKTRALLPPKDNIYLVLDKYLPRLKDGDIVFITSKILSIHQGRCVKKTKNKNQKSKLVDQEADYKLPKNTVVGSEIVLTIKENTLIPSAGIDASNANGYFILWPKNVNQSLKEIRKYLMGKSKLKKLGVIATDSHTTPLRWGTLGISIGSAGMEPLYDYRGKRDIFGRTLSYTQANIVDAISAMAVLVMGEGKEKIPIVILRDAKFVKFTNKDRYSKLLISPKKDLYYPLLKVFKKSRA